jgi:hypothetical protein
MNLTLLTVTVPPELYLTRLWCVVAKLQLVGPTGLLGPGTRGSTPADASVEAKAMDTTNNPVTISRTNNTTNQRERPTPMAAVPRRDATRSAVPEWNLDLR